MFKDLAEWLPRLGLQKNKSARLIVTAVQAIHHQRDRSDIAGSWSEDPDFEIALAEQDTTLEIRENAECDSTAGNANV